MSDVVMTASKLSSPGFGSSRRSGPGGASPEAEGVRVIDRPDLAALADLHARAVNLSPDEMVGELERIKTIALRLALTPPSGNGQGEDRLLTVDEAALKLAVTKDWLRRRSDDLPFVVKLSEGVVRYSAKGIEQYIAARAG
jgi:predicted DNA-binding transcriptional regulator AlpA